MNNGLKLKFSKIIVFTMMLCTLTAFMVANISLKAEAATKVPNIKVFEKSLFAGKDTYQMKIYNLLNTSTVTYTSNDDAVATVSDTGLITAKSEGSAVVKAVVLQNTKKYYLRLTVKVLTPTITITDSTDYLNIADTYLFKAEKLGIDSSVNWSVSDTTKANISNDGRLTANASGKVTVYAKAGDKTAEYTVFIGTNRLGTFSNHISCYSEQKVWITIPDKMLGEELGAINSNSEILDYQWGEKIDNKVALTIKPKKIGQTKLTISSNKTDDRMILYVEVTEVPYKTSMSSTREIAEKYKSATVAVTSTKNGNEAKGTGFFIAEDLIATNNHTIIGADRVYITTSNSNRYEILQIVGYNATADIAILKVDTKHDYLTINASGIGVDNDVYSLGSPLDAGLSVIPGKVIQKSYFYDNVDYIQITNPVTLASSGGPLLNNYGEVVGINSIYNAGSSNKNNAINVNELLKINTNKPTTLAKYNETIKYELLNGSVSSVVKEENLTQYFSALLNKYTANLYNNYNNNYYYNPNYDYSYLYSGQFIPSGLGVQGIVQKYANMDTYRIKVTNTCTVAAVCYLENIGDYQNISFQLSNSSSQILQVGTPYMGSLSYKIVYQLSPGEYIFNIQTTYNPYRYNSLDEHDIPYTFSVVY